MLLGLWSLHSAPDVGEQRLVDRDPLARIGVQRDRYRRIGREVLDEHGQPSEGETRPPLFVASPAVPIVDPIPALKVGLHGALVLAHDAQEADQFPADFNPIRPK